MSNELVVVIALVSLLSGMLVGRLL